MNIVHCVKHVFTKSFHCLKETLAGISNDNPLLSPFIMWHVGFTTEPLKGLYEQKLIDIHFFFRQFFVFNCCLNKSDQRIFT